jgi:ferredoxin--NADP+ reductase
MYVAIVGSGPAAFFSAAALLKVEEPAIHIDMFERLPTPWGLVRSGVAPDHPKIKSVSAIFAKTATNDRFRFFGNIELGRDLARQDLLEQYDAVLYAMGAQGDRPLGVPDEGLSGSIGASELVGWYNAHPDFAAIPLDLSVRAATLIGNGNVALDVARILTMQPSELRFTDIADHALDALAESSVEEVTVVGRRGPLQAAFTTAELRELGELADVHVNVDPADLVDISDEDLATAGPVARLNIEVLRDLAARRRSSRQRRQVTLKFMRSPAELRGQDRVEEIVLARNDLRSDGAGRVVAVDSGEREHLETGLVVRAIGYRGTRIDGVPFDGDRGVIPNVKGRVDAGDREYVVGWIKRGPSGIIGTNKKCAQDTVETMMGDLASGALTPRRARIAPPDLAGTKGVAAVLAEHWLAIDRHELEAGRASGRPRVKIGTWDHLLAVAHRAIGDDAANSQERAAERSELGSTSKRTRQRGRAAQARRGPGGVHWTSHQEPLAR